MGRSEPVTSSTTLPPADEDAEQVVLGAAMASADALDEAAETLVPASFYRPAHAELFGVMLDMRSIGKPVEPISLCHHLGQRVEALGGASYLHTLMQRVPAAVQAPYYIEIVAETASRRALVAFATQVMQSAYASSDTLIGELLERARAALEAIEAGPRTTTGPSGVLLRLADVQAERLAWLWPGRLPAGKLVTLDGDPSLGKSTLAITFAAHVSTGKPWPDGEPCETGDVVVLSAEDGLADTIRPRLDAAEGDPDRVHALTAVRAVDADGVVTTRPPTLADVGAIRGTITRTSARLLIVDVLMAYMPGKVDSHRDQDVRAVLHRLAEMADDTGCTVLLLRHLNKSAGGSAMYRGGGSIGIVGAARAGYVVAPDPDDPELRVLACLKSNLAATPESLTYRLEPAPGADVARVAWVGASAHTAGELLGPVESNEDRDERDEVQTWLKGLLEDGGGAVGAKQVLYKDAKDAGYSVDQVKRAKKKLGLKAEKAGMQGGWVWVDPSKSRSEGSAEGSEGSGV